MRKYDFVVWSEEGKWTAHCPDVPGVYGIGKTRKRAEADLKEAMTEMAAHLREKGERLPPARGFATGTLTLHD
jgi:predicted RNase H-like HicB family nuclease